MAFDKDKLNRISAGNHNIGVSIAWSYTDTSDTIANLTASGFFNNWAYFKVTDLIYITANNGRGFYYVNAISPNVTLLPVSSSSGGSSTLAVTVLIADSFPPFPALPVLERTIINFPIDVTITEVTFICEEGSGLVADNTDYATMFIAKRNYDGTSRTTVASITTQTTGSGGTGDIDPFVAVDVPVTSGSVSATQSLTVYATKSGAGVTFPTGTFSITYTV